LGYLWQTGYSKQPWSFLSSGIGEAVVWERCTADFWDWAGIETATHCVLEASCLVAGVVGLCYGGSVWVVLLGPEGTEGWRVCGSKS